LKSKLVARKLFVSKKVREVLMATMVPLIALIQRLFVRVLEKDTAQEIAWEEELVKITNASAMKVLLELIVVSANNLGLSLMRIHYSEYTLCTFFSYSPYFFHFM